jgi:hypothetical protein
MRHTQAQDEEALTPQLPRWQDVYLRAVEYGLGLWHAVIGMHPIEYLCQDMPEGLQHRIYTLWNSVFEDFSIEEEEEEQHPWSGSQSQSQECSGLSQGHSRPNSFISGRIERQGKSAKRRTSFSRKARTSSTPRSKR